MFGLDIGYAQAYLKGYILISSVLSLGWLAGRPNFYDVGWLPGRA